MQVWFFDQPFDRAHHMIVFKRCEDPFLIIDLLVNVLGLVMFACLHLDCQLQPASLAELAHELDLD